MVCIYPDTASDEDRIVKHLFTLGEVAQLCPAQIPQRVFMLVQSLIASPVIVGGKKTSVTLHKSTY